MFLIAGGGLAGLGAACHLEEVGCDYLLVEKAERLGGLCRSIHVEGYTFDYSGHVLCFQDREMLEWVRSLLDGNLASFERRASIYVQGKLVPYPFQAHLGALSPEMTRECLVGYLRAVAHPENSHPSEDFMTWILRTFGQGMAQHFFLPYNRKLWGIPLEELHPEGLIWSVPRPSLEQVMKGARGGTNRHLGYNPQIYYPTEGGIERLPEALAGKISSVRTGCGIQRLLWRERMAELEDGRRVSYEGLISSIPLPHLLRLLQPVPSWASEVAAALRWISVWVLNVGIAREHVSDAHWIYFPEEDFPFFRVGCYSAFGPHLTPPGCSSLYVEVSGHVVHRLETGRWVDACLEGLRACEILLDLEEVQVIAPLYLRVAYVIHDEARKNGLPRVRQFLSEQGIHLAGRYGAWGYGTMEQALRQGRDAAIGLMR